MIAGFERFPSVNWGLYFRNSTFLLPVRLSDEITHQAKPWITYASSPCLKGSPSIDAYTGTGVDSWPEHY